MFYTYKNHFEKLRLKLLQMDTIETVTGLVFLDQLHAMYYTAKHLVVMFGKIQGKSANYEVKNTFTDYREVNKSHIRRIEKIFAIMGEQPAGRKCDEVLDVMKEADEVIRKTPEDSHSRDEGLIKAAQKAENFGMDICCNLADLAKKLGVPEAAKLLRQTLEEEKQASNRFEKMQNKFAYRYVSWADDFVLPRLSPFTTPPQK